MLVPLIISVWRFFLNNRRCWHGKGQTKEGISVVNVEWLEQIVERRQYFLYLFFGVFQFRETHIFMHFLLLVHHSRQVHSCTKIAALICHRLSRQIKFERFSQKTRQQSAVN